jgi:glycosyltransferase involved in cell wall biosynthesis
MKILHITQLLGVGGLERLVQSLILEQLKSGHQVALLVYGEDQTWVPHFRSLGIEVLNGYQKKSGYDLALLRVILEKSKGYDVIHSHDLNPAMYLGPLRALAALGLLRFPHWVHTAHGMEHLTRRPVTTWYERIFTRMSDAAIGVAAHICDTYQEKIWLRKNKIHQIDNGIAITALVRPARSVRLEKLKELLAVSVTGPVWICVSRVVPLKDQGLILAAAGHLPESTFLLVGPSGDDRYWQELQDKRPPNVIFLGSRNDIPLLLSLCDFYVSPSRHEGIPLAVLEAGVSGIPAVLSDIHGHKTLQRSDAPIARFFKTGHAAELTLALKELEQNPTAGETFAENFQAVVRTHYSQERMAADYMRVYQQVLA